MFDAMMFLLGAALVGLGLFSGFRIYRAGERAGRTAEQARIVTITARRKLAWMARERERAERAQQFPIERRHPRTQRDPRRETRPPPVPLARCDHMNPLCRCTDDDDDDIVTGD